MRAVERSAESLVLSSAARLGAGRELGWILIEHPVAGMGWHRVLGAVFDPQSRAWVQITCVGREVYLGAHASKKLWWSPVKPPPKWWIPW